MVTHYHIRNCCVVDVELVALYKLCIMRVAGRDIATFGTFSQSLKFLISSAVCVLAMQFVGRRFDWVY